jgi:hypothetical protein
MWRSGTTMMTTRRPGGQGQEAGRMSSCPAMPGAVDQSLQSGRYSIPKIDNLLTGAGGEGAGVEPNHRT